MHKLADLVFGITQKLIYITLSNLVRQYITNKGIFLNMFCNLKSDWSLVPGTLLGYLPNLERGLGLAFGAQFLHDFPIKMFLI